jgi:hypothetical protein
VGVTGYNLVGGAEKLDRLVDASGIRFGLVHLLSLD